MERVKYYFIKATVSGSLKTNEGHKLIYFVVRSKPARIEKAIHNHCRENSFDLIEIHFVTKL